MEQYSPQPEEQHLFDENRYHLVQASGGKRFANYIIDQIIFYIFIKILFSILAFLNLGLNLSLDPNTNGLATIILLVSALYAGFLGFLEFILKGKTIGKFLTGTRAVMEDGSPLTLQKALLRGLCRLIPFNIFSALGNTCYPWHDSVSKTYVIDERQSKYPL